MSKIDTATRHGFYAANNPARHYIGGKGVVAEFHFTIEPRAFEQQIQIDTSVWFEDQPFLVSAEDERFDFHHETVLPALYGVTSTEANPPSCCQGLTGDVNASGGTNLTDLSLLVNMLFTTYEPVPCLPAANLNGDKDCVINLTDLTLLVQDLFVCFGCAAPCSSFDNFVCGRTF